MGNLIHETESFFKTRDKEYQETIGQIEVRAWVLEPPEKLCAMVETPGQGLVEWDRHKIGARKSY